MAPSGNVFGDFPLVVRSNFGCVFPFVRYRVFGGVVCQDLSFASYFRFYPVGGRAKGACIAVRHCKDRFVLALDDSSLNCVGRQLFTPVNFVPVREVFLYLSVGDGRPLRVAYLCTALYHNQDDGVGDVPGVEDCRVEIFKSCPPLGFIGFDERYLEVGLEGMSSSFTCYLFLLIGVNLNAVLERGGPMV